MLSLSNQIPFASGGRRDCFVHPEMADRCVKIIRRGRQEILSKKRYPFIRRIFRKREHYDENYREMLSYRYAESLRDERIWRHLPRYYGLVETDLGRGSVIQLMRDFDGNISMTLSQRVQRCGNQGALDESCRESLEDLKSFLTTTGFLPRNLKLKNILSVRLSEHQECLYIIDDIGFREWIPLAKWCRPLAKHKIRKRIALLEKRLMRITGYNEPTYTVAQISGTTSFGDGRTARYENLRKESCMINNSARY